MSGLEGRQGCLHAALKIIDPRGSELHFEILGSPQIPLKKAFKRILAK